MRKTVIKLIVDEVTGDSITRYTEKFKDFDAENKANNLRKWLESLTDSYEKALRKLKREKRKKYHERIEEHFRMNGKSP